MPESPYVALTVSDLDPRSIQQVTDRSLGNPREVIESALMSYRLMVINHVKSEIAKQASVTGSVLLNLVDIAGALYLKRFNSIVGPVAVSAYVRAYQRANAGDVPAEVLYALAEKHADRLGTYFNETSKEALVEGFNAYVNKQVPARMAADRALDAYGLTSRQMRGYVALAPTEKVSSVSPKALKARVLEYIGKSIRSRLKIFATQEIHNIDQQAEQTAWMWMADKGMLSPDAQKVWITAKDEKVCPICGPMHGEKVGVNERFKLPNGMEIYVPGVHPNCRCNVRLQNPVRQMAIAKADLTGGALQDFNRKHPRDRRGRFAEVAERRSVIEPAAEEVIAPAEVIAPKPKLGAPELSRPALGRPTLGQPQLSLGKPVVLGAEAPLALGTYAEPALGREPARLAMPDRRVILQDTKQVLAGLRPPQRRTRMRRDTIKIPHDGAVYAVIDPMMIGNNDRIEMTTDTTFTPDESEAAFEAYERFEQAITDGVDEVNYTYSAQIVQHYISQSGEELRLHADIDEDDVEDIVRTVAMQSQDPDWYGDKITVPVDWYDGHGDFQYRGEVTYREIIEQWGLHHEQFEVTIVRLQEGHDSSLGQTYMDEAGASSAYETWRTSGRYWVEDTNRVQIGSSVPLRVADLIPVVETYEEEYFE